MNKNPFPGIRSFRADESHLFFGREQQVKEIISILSDRQFLAVIGSSGSGKSSLVQAGLIPTLKKLELNNSNQWTVTVFSPGSTPIINLATGLYNTLQTNKIKIEEFQTVNDIQSHLLSDKNALVEYIQIINKKTFNNHLIIVDQFEEIFRLRELTVEEELITETTTFINLMLRLVEDKEQPAYLVLTMRSDFIDDCTEFKGLNEIINNGSYLIPRMGESELRIAINGPIALFGKEISEQLIDTLIDDLGNRYDQLPVLQHSLMRTWDFHVKNSTEEQPIDIMHYQAIGTISEAVSIHAEEIYNAINEQNIRLLTERVFKSLIILGTDNRATRKPSTLAELCLLTASKEEEVIEVVELFRRAENSFLMPPPQIPLHEKTVVDISHESIMRIWARLKEWVESETHSADLYRRLCKSAELYHLGRTGLWINPELEVAVKWIKEERPTHSWAMRYDTSFDRAIQFLEFSRKEHEKKIEEKELKQKKELRRARNFAIILGVASVVSILFLIFAMMLKFQADNSSEIALQKELLARQKSIEAQNESRFAMAQKRIADQQEDLAMQQKRFTEIEKLNAIRAQERAFMEREAAVEARKIADNEKHRANKNAALANEARVEAERQEALALEQKNEAERQRMEAERLRILELARSLAIRATSIYDSQQDTLAQQLAFEAYQLNLDKGGNMNDPEIYASLSKVVGEANVFKGHTDGVRDVSVAANGFSFASVANENKIFIWDLHNPESATTLSQRGRKVLNFSTISYFPESSNLLVAGSLSGEIAVWNTNNIIEPQEIILQHKGRVNELTFSTTGNYLLSTSSDSTIVLWKNTDSKLEVLKAEKFSAPISAAVYDELNSRIIVATAKNELLIMNPNNGNKVTLPLNDSPATALAISKNSELLAVGQQNGKITLINLTTSKIIEVLIGHVSKINDLKFSHIQGSNLLASCSYDGTIRIWDYENTTEEPIIISQHQNWVYSLAFSLDGKELISTSADRTLRTWATNTEILANLIVKKDLGSISTSDWNKYIGEDIERRED